MQPGRRRKGQPRPESEEDSRPQGVQPLKARPERSCAEPPLFRCSQDECTHDPLISFRVVNRRDLSTMEDDTEASARESGCTGASCGLSQNDICFVRSISVLLLCLFDSTRPRPPLPITLLATCYSHTTLLLYNKLDGVLTEPAHPT